MSKGGNAVDAAIATLLCDGVICPEYLGIGGGFLMSIYNATTKKVITVNARETAPAAASTSMFVKNPEKSLYGTYKTPRRLSWHNLLILSLNKYRKFKLNNLSL